MRAHELFGPVLRRVRAVDIGTGGSRATALGHGGICAIDASGGLVFNAKASADASRWVWSICHVLTHIGFGHADPGHRDGRGSYSPEWRAAGCLVVDRFLHTLNIPGAAPTPPGYDGDEDELAQRFASQGIPAFLAAAGPAGGAPDLWEDLFGGRPSIISSAASPLGRAFAVGLEAVLAARQPLPPWDVGLAAWFDERFPELTSPRPLALPPGPAVPGLARLSPPSRLPEGPDPARALGVVLDASGSMDGRLLDRALGSIAASAAALGIRRARVVVCDAAVHDAGWLPPDEIAGRITIRGQGGPALQPGIDLLLTDRTFPRQGPILLITDGRCDNVRVGRDHAWMTSGPLPFATRSPVFQLC